MPNERADRTESVNETAQAPDRKTYEALSPAAKDNLKVVADSFVWFGIRATAHIDAMAAQIKKKDPPSLMEGLMETLVDVALGAGSAAAGERLFHAVEDLVGAGAVRKEFVKGLFEEGVKAGIVRGRAAISGVDKSSADVVDTFILSQKEGVSELGQASQASFETSGKLKVATDEDAASMAKVCKGDAMKKAGEAQAEATRDAWLAYLAQAKFGKNDDGTTNMMNAAERKQRMAWATHTIPERAPQIADTIQGNVPGVLVVKAELPAVSAARGVSGKPEIKLAIINGVNDKLREEYAGKPLSDSHIPRQIVAEVDGDLPNFTLNLTEAGGVQGLDNHEWLEARGTVGNDDGKAKSPEHLMRGVRALLEDLIPKQISKGALE